MQEVPHKSCDDIVLENRYVCLKELGRGSFGNVYKAYDTQTSSTVAVKRIRIGNRTRISEFQHEVDMLKHVTKQCEQVSVCYLDSFVKDGYAYLVTDYIVGTEVSEISAMINNAADMVLLMYDIAWSLTEIHSLGLAHNDIQPKNILVTSDYTFRFIDFGLSCLENCSPRGTMSYTSPEKIKMLIRGKRLSLADSQRADIYSLGVLFYEFANMKPPRSPVKSRESLFSWVEAIEDFHEHSIYFDPQSPTVVLQDINNIIESCINNDPTKRPTAQQLVKSLETLLDSIPDDNTD